MMILGVCLREAFMVIAVGTHGFLLYRMFLGVKIQVA